MIASYSRSISNENRNKVRERLYKSIEGASTMGVYETVCFEDLIDEELMELINNGYTVRKNTDPIGKSVFLISWR